MKRNVRYTPAQKRAMKSMTPAKRAAFKKMIGRSPAIATVRAGRTKARRNKARRARPNRALVPGKATQTAYERGHARIFGTKAAKPKRPKKADFVAAQMRRGRSKKQAEASWKITYGRKAAKAAASRKKKPRTYAGGRLRALKARVGGKSKQTYLYRTKKGTVRHLPEYAVLGYASARAMSLARKTARGEATYQRRKAALQQRRGKAATRSARRIRAGKGFFAPNAGGELLTFEEWKKAMKPNKKRTTRKKKAKPKKKTKAQLKAIRKRAGKKAARTRAANKRRRSAAAKKGAKKRTTKRTTKRKTTRRKTTKRRGMTKAQRSAAAKKAARTRAANKRRRSAAAKKGARKKTKRRRTSRARSMSIVLRPNATRKQLAAARRNIRKAQAARWRKNAALRYDTNPAEAFVADLKGALKIGAIVVTGFMAHRALSKVLSDYVLSKVGAMQTGGLARWRDTIASVIVAAAGVPLAVKLVPRESAAAGAGIAASLLQGLIITALAEAQQPEVASYLSAYPNAGSPAWPGIGSYYTFKPRQVFPQSGFGEYYSLGPAPLRTNQLTQAAGAFRPMQAAAGMGALVTQAAAGQGEYLVYGAEGIGGNYETVPMAQQPMHIDDGVMPNLHSAEDALNVMEATAGVGQADIPLQSTVNPLQLETPIGDEPRGSRSGIFQGGGGIFG